MYCVNLILSPFEETPESVGSVTGQQMAYDQRSRVCFNYHTKESGNLGKFKVFFTLNKTSSKNETLTNTSRTEYKGSLYIQTRIETQPPETRGI